MPVRTQAGDEREAGARSQALALAFDTVKAQSNGGPMDVQRVLDTAAKYHAFLTQSEAKPDGE